MCQIQRKPFLVKKGTKEDIKLQVPRLTKENIQRCLLPYQICDKRQCCQKMVASKILIMVQK